MHTPTQVVNDVTAAIPIHKENVNFKQVTKDLGITRQSPRVLAAPFSLQDELDGIILMVSNLSHGRPPKEQDIPQKMMLKRCEDSFEITPLGKIANGSNSAPVERLRGAAAILYLYNQTKEQMEGGGAGMTLQELKPLSQFRWVLSAAQRAEVQDWLRRVASSSAAPGMVTKAIVDSATGDELSVVPLIAASKGGAGSSSSNGVMAPAGVAHSKKATLQNDKRDADRADIMRFFQAKARKTT